MVDPGVGSARRPILVEAAGHLFVAPDNGVLTMLFDTVLNYKVREITASRYFREPVSHTFHGRDIFAPVAAHLASGLPPGKLGRRIEDPVRLDFAKPVLTGRNKWTGSILKIDKFGNLITNFDSNAWRRLAAEPFEIRLGALSISRMASSYAAAEPEELFVIPGSTGYLEISVNQGSAHARTHCTAETPINLYLL